MNLEELINVSDFCANHEITHALIVSFQEYGLVEIVESQNTWYLPVTELPKAERIVRLYADLDINLEGIAVVTQLLDRMTQMQNEITTLKNRLQRYE